MCAIIMIDLFSKSIINENEKIIKRFKEKNYEKYS